MYDKFDIKENGYFTSGRVCQFSLESIINCRKRKEFSVMWNDKKDPQRGRKAKIGVMNSVLYLLTPYEAYAIDSLKSTFMHNVGSSKVKADGCSGENSMRIKISDLSCSQ
jgi:hypothetical protein